MMYDREEGKLTITFYLVGMLRNGVDVTTEKAYNWTSFKGTHT
jgi:hypothetical protein